MLEKKERELIIGVTACSIQDVLHECICDKILRDKMEANIFLSKPVCIFPGPIFVMSFYVVGILCDVHALVFQRVLMIGCCSRGCVKMLRPANTTQDAQYCSATVEQGSASWSEPVHGVRICVQHMSVMNTK